MKMKLGAALRFLLGFNHKKYEDLTNQNVDMSHKNLSKENQECIGF